MIRKLLSSNQSLVRIEAYRILARNKDTAATLDRLGLAEYFAMEAYVVE